MPCMGKSVSELPMKNTIHCIGKSNSDLPFGVNNTTYIDWFYVRALDILSDIYGQSVCLNKGLLIIYFLLV